MKRKLYKNFTFLLAVFFISSIQAQKFDKKYNENFKVNKNVKLVINANSSEVNVTTWRKNEVAVEAIITVEGLSKKEAQKVLDKWVIEALGNKSKVEVNAKNGKFLHFEDFNFDFDFSDLKFPEMNFDNIKIAIPDFEFPEFPEINFDDMNFEFKKGDQFTFNLEDGSKKITIKNKEDWEKFKKSEDYKKFKKELREKELEMNKRFKKAKIELEKIDKKKIQKEIEKAKNAYKRIDKQKIERSLAKARRELERANINLDRLRNNDNTVIIINDGDSKKEVRITRKINIKVPEKATFELNTRHSKVTLPKGKTSGKVSYGTFNSTDIIGGELSISYSPVAINSLNACTLFLNNVTDAKLASVTNSKVTSSSGGLIIENVKNDVEINSSFGDVTIKELISNYNTFKISLNQANAEISLGNLKENLFFDVGGKMPAKIASPSVTSNGNNTQLIGNFTISTKDNKLKILGKYSELLLKNKSLINKNN